MSSVCYGDNRQIKFSIKSATHLANLKAVMTGLNIKLEPQYYTFNYRGSWKRIFKQELLEAEIYLIWWLSMPFFHSVILTVIHEMANLVVKHVCTWIINYIVKKNNYISHRTDPVQIIQHISAPYLLISFVNSEQCCNLRKALCQAWMKGNKSAAATKPFTFVRINFITS